jgi:hypothetical protein
VSNCEISSRLSRRAMISRRSGRQPAFCTRQVEGERFRNARGRILIARQSRGAPNE